jgi:hypothetical protein
VSLKKWSLAILLLVVVALVVGACGSRSRRQGDEWTPSPVIGSLAIGTRAPELLPAATPTVEIPTAVLPTAVLPTTVRPTAAAATSAPTRDPNVVVITEADVLRAVTSGAVTEQGATLENVNIQFTADGKMMLTASRVGYGFVNADNVTMVGRLIAVDGKLEFQTESVTPRGIVTSLIPTIANQALQQYTSRWYIEDIQTTEGQIELRVRP